MGEPLRLRQDVDNAGFSPHAQATLKELKKHGCSWPTTVATGDCPSHRIGG
ncbi:MAG: hypothetical protein M3X11_14725 [Acidobacteriota bacterium]|nr:hypothetical protein [Acidobacteriota bacterium]